MKICFPKNLLCAHEYYLSDFVPFVIPVVPFVVRINIIVYPVLWLSHYLIHLCSRMRILERFKGVIKGGLQLR